MASTPHRQHESSQAQQQQQQQQQQSKPTRNHAGVSGGPITAPIPIFAPSKLEEQYGRPSFLQLMGVAPAPAVEGVEGGPSCGEPRPKRPKEQEFLKTSSPVSPVDLLRAGMGPFSSRPGLSLLDNGHAATAAAASSSSGNLPPPNLREELNRITLQLDAEMERLVKMQGARLRNEILEQIHLKHSQALRSVEERVHQKIREKEAELESINKKNMELEEQMKQANLELGAWQQHAKYNENMIAALKHNLEQVQAQGRENMVEETASCCGGGAINSLMPCEESEGSENLLTCKLCKVNEACMILLPCRHLCLCKNCEGKIGFCPVCKTSKFIGIKVFLE